MLRKKPNLEEQPLRTWLATVDMGLGHQRAVHPLLDLAEGGLITVGKDSASYPEEIKTWNRMQRTYDSLSRIRSIPIIGKPLFGLVDSIQSIAPFYPMTDKSHPTYQVRFLSRSIGRGMCKGMLEKIAEKPLPLITSHPIPALAADTAEHGLIYCIVCDAEISRTWVAEEPRKSRIQYLAPCGRAVRRLRSYGVPDERIFLTGFPFPKSVLGDEGLDLLLDDVGQRLLRLDPHDRFWPLHGRNVEHFLGRANCKPKGDRPLTITYAVGGAGAQKEYGAQIAESLADEIRGGAVMLNLVAGVRPEVNEYFHQVKASVLPDDDGISVIYRESKAAYFEEFARIIRNTDVLWTKPSELSFYCGLGIPIIMAPTLGAQEIYNRRWLQEIQAGIDQEDPRYTHQWLFHLLEEGRLAESAWDGFLKARKFGTYKIGEILATGTMAHEGSPSSSRGMRIFPASTRHRASPR
jgi:hypothetical protein